MNKWNTFIYCFFSLYSLYCFADTRVTVLESTTEQQINAVAPVLFNDALIYQIESENQTELWAYKTITQEKTMIFTGELMASANSRLRSNYLLLMNDRVVFTAHDGESASLFKSDGTLEGTIAMDSPVLAQAGGYFKDDLLFTWADNGKLVTTDGETVRQHPITYAEINKVCGFNNDDVIALENAPVIATVIRSSNGERTNLSEYLPIGFSGITISMLRLKDHCLITGGSATEKEALLVAETGELIKLSELLDITQFNDFFVFNDRLYAFQENANSNPFKIVRFNQTYGAIDKEFIVTEAQRFFRLSNSQEFIIAQSVTANADQVTSYTYFLDQNLTLNQQLSGLDKPRLTTSPVLGGELYSAVMNQNNKYVQALSTNPTFPPSMSTFIIDQRVSSLITNPTSNDVYVLLEDRDFQTYSIAKLSEKPDINHSTAGIWHDPLIQNQGLVINRGQRADGSAYLFVSVYTQDQGQPLWLAGNADITLPQATIDIELSFYTGTGFFEPDTEAIRTPWGQVKLEMTACDGLRATFTQANEPTRSIDLVRIDNTQFDHLCSD